MGNNQRRTKAAPLQERLLECTDKNNRLLGYLPESLVRQQRLCHRQLVILIGDEYGHLLFRLQEENCLALPVQRDQPAGQAFTDYAAETLLEENYSPYYQLQDLGYLQSPGQNPLRLFYARMAHSHLVRKITTKQDGLLLDADELKGLWTSAQITVEPLLQTLLTHKIFADFLQGKKFPAGT
ncbi:MAG: hypothetical protein K6G15_00450 [Desulfovibrio sp.]|nr:hypothetical protein [Desulfovibrio sp.]